MRRLGRLLFLAIALLAAACNYDFPLSTKPSRPIESRLLGEWTAMNDDGKPEHMTVRQWDADHYVVEYDSDVYRAFHTDVAGLPILSIQDLKGSERKYLYITWRFEAGNLRLRAMRTEVVPESTPDAATAVKLIEKNRDNPQLFNEGAVFKRDRR